MSQKWTYEEIRLVAVSYFEMLQAEVNSTPYVKAEYHRQLMKLLPHRTNGSIQMLCQNISAVLEEKNFIYINGYKPLRHVSPLQRHVVTEVLLTDSERSKFLKKNSNIELERIVFTEVPKRSLNDNKGNTRFKATQKDYLLELKEKQEIGEMGELFVLEIEKQRLKNIKREDLAEQVDWVSKTKGDGLGYDILSFESDGSFRYIEVKSTNSGKSAPFFISANELAFAQANRDQFYIYRVFNMGQEDVQIFVLSGDLQECKLEPVAYRVII